MGPSVLIVDDHPGFRRWARRLLERSGFRVVGEVATAATAEQRLRELRPDIVLLDVMLPDRSGVGFANDIATRAQRTAVVLVSSHDRSDLALDDLIPGAPVGFIDKAALSRASLRRVLASIGAP